MKLRHLFLAAIVALGMMACNNEDAPDLGKQAEGKVSVKVITKNSSNGTRAITDLDGDGILPAGLAAESAIKTLEVYIFDATTGVADGYSDEFEAVAVEDAYEVVGIETHAGAKVVYVVANGDLGPKSTLSDLQDATNAVPVDIDEDGLVMTGYTEEITLIAGENTYGYESGDLGAGSPLQIERVNARVAIVDAKLNLADGQNLIFDNLQDVEVAIFNVPSKSKLFGIPGSLAINEDFLKGADWVTTQKTYDESATLDGTNFLDVVDFPIEIKKSPTFYVNENTSAVRVMPDLDADPTAEIPTNKQTLIVLRGKPYLVDNHIISEDLYTDEDGYTYYPVKVNFDGTITGGGDNKGTGKVFRNTQYNIYLTITGIGNPTIDEVEDAFLDVKVEILPWVTVKQEVEW